MLPVKCKQLIKNARLAQVWFSIITASSKISVCKKLIYQLRNWQMHENAFIHEQKSYIYLILEI